MKLDASTIASLKAKVVEWFQLVTALAGAVNDARLDTAEWWRARRRMMNLPKRPPTPDEFARTLDRVCAAFEPTICEQINRPCVLGSLLPVKRDGGPIKWN
jgi:hypothetical protein